MKLKIRPFKDEFEGQIRFVSGDIVENQFFISIDAASYKIPIVEISEDHRGPYVLVEEGLIDLGFNYFLKVQAEYDGPDSLPGCEVSFGVMNDSKKIDDILLDHGVDVEKINLMHNPATEFITIYFGPSGRKNGKGQMITREKMSKEKLRLITN